MHAGLVLVELTTFLRAVEQHVEDAPAEQRDSPAARHWHQRDGVDVLEQELVVGIDREEATLFWHRES